MRIGVVGAGYVGLVTGTCLAEMGNDVVIVDVIKEKIDTLKKGNSPHYEPGLDDILKRNIREGRLEFGSECIEAVKDTEAIFIAVGTPQDEKGAADLTYLESAFADIAAAMKSYRLLIIKSTVPVGTNRAMTAKMKTLTSQPFDIASNPEFLKEGAAIDDFMRPDRVVTGVRSDRAEKLVRQIYAPFVRTGHPIMVVDPESAEMVKYVSNALLASRISFMNEMSRICAAVGADIELVREGVGADRRIGSAFLFAGLGYGGSCFPKDVRALSNVAQGLNLEAHICDAIDRVNVEQFDILMPVITGEFGEDLSGVTFAMWGLAFKPRTDDVREAPALHMARQLTGRGAKVVAFDPEAIQTTKREIGDLITYADGRDAALENADALIVCTEWNEFRSPDFAMIKSRLKRPVIFDGRNLYSLKIMRDEGFIYYSIGRPAVTQ